MKTIGMLGGMSWESTVSYYKTINREVKNTLGGLHSAKIILNSVDFEEINKLQHQGRWDTAAELLITAAKSVEAGGADLLIICTNTMHKLFEEIEAAIAIPVLHIADATAQAVVADNIARVGLLGTQFTMQQDFYKGRLIEKFGLNVVVPDSEQQTAIHDIIYAELCLGVIRDASRQTCLDVIRDLIAREVEAVILACTELALLIKPEHISIPLYDTTTIHAEEAVKLALS